MAVTLTATGFTDCAPGNTVTLAGAFSAIPGTLVMAGQGGDGSTSTSIGGVTWTSTGVTFTVPDGLRSGYLVVSTSDGYATSTGLRVQSQYVQAAEYIGEGMDVSQLAVGELDLILKDASAYVDAYCCNGNNGETETLRIMQVIEQDNWRQSRKYYPRRLPVISCDAYKIIISNSQFAQILPADTIVVQDMRYIEVLSYAVTTYAIFGAIENLGYSANVVQIMYTAGWGQLNYPRALRTATKQIATELLTQRAWRIGGAANLSKLKQGAREFDRRTEPYTIPKPVMAMLAPYRVTRLS